MLNVSIGGSREGSTGGITGKEQASLFGIHASAYAIIACNLYRYHCEGPHTLYYIHRHALSFLSLSLSIIKNAPQNQHPDTAYDFSSFQKTGIYVKALFIKKLRTKFTKIGREIKKL